LLVLNIAVNYLGSCPPQKKRKKTKRIIISITAKYGRPKNLQLTLRQEKLIFDFGSTKKPREEQTNNE
jgi:hypothetical protein